MDHYGFLWPYCVAALVGDCSSLVVPGVLLAHPWSQSVFEDALELGSHLWCDGKGLGQPFVTLYLQRVSREWAEHSSQLEEQQVPVWHSAVDTNMTGHEHIRWRGTKGLQGMGEHQAYRAGRVHRALSLLQVLSGALQEDLGMGMWQQAGVAWLGKKVSTSATAFLLSSLYMCAPWLGWHWQAWPLQTICLCSRQGSFAHGGHSQGYIVPSGRLEGGGMASQDQGGRVPNPHPHPHFTRRY